MHGGESRLNDPRHPKEGETDHKAQGSPATPESLPLHDSSLHPSMPSGQPLP
jgi:hypothetical protein